MKRYMIEGEWSGYRSSQQRVVHRSYTTNQMQAEAIEKMHAIYYTDGTALYLTVTELKKGERRKLPTLNQYNSLIADCLHHNVNSVQQLINLRKAA